MSGRIKPTTIKKGKIPLQEPPPPKEVIFSFKYVDFISSKFTINGQDFNYFKSLLERLKDVSTLEHSYCKHNNSKALRIHPIRWNETTEPKGYQHIKNKQLWEAPYQISISSNKHGRLHGFFINNVFFVVWFDPKHDLYS